MNPFGVAPEDAVRGSDPAGAEMCLRLALFLPRSAGRRVAIAMGATDDAPEQLMPVPAAEIRVR